ncbi:MAG: twin-arginine translocase subunit TatC [Acidimicrobiales bacterium]
MSVGAVPSESRGGEMPLMEHLGELRDRLVKSVIAVAIGLLIGFVLYDSIFDILIKPYQDIAAPDRQDLLQTDPLEGFSVRMKVSAYTGIGLAMPVILWQLWQFVAPGLYAKERRYAIPFVLSALVLFFLGAGLAYLTLPQALDFLSSIGGENLEQQYTPSKYFQLITYTMLAFGLGFEFPILLVFLQLAGILQPETLAKGRRYALVGIVVLVAVITPSGDPISLTVLSVPMYLFFELSVVAGRLLRRRREAVDDPGDDAVDDAAGDAEVSDDAVT